MKPTSKRALEILDDLYIRTGQNVRYDDMEFVIINDAQLDEYSADDTECDVIWIWVDVVNIMEDFDAGYLNVAIPKDVFFHEKDLDWRQYIRNYSYDANTVDDLADNGYWDREPDLNKKTKMGGFLKKKVSNKNTKSALPGAKYPWLFDSRIELNRKISVCESIDLYTYTDDKVGTKYRLEVMINPDRSEMYRTYTLRDGGFLIGQYSTLAEAESHIGDNFVGFKNPTFKGFKPVHKTKNEKKRPFKKRK